MSQRGRRQYYHHHSVSSAASVDSISSAGGQVAARQIMVRPTVDSQLSSLKRLHSSSEIIPATTRSRVTSSIDAPLEQLSLPPPLIPMPVAQPASTTPAQQSSGGSRARTLLHQSRRSAPTTPPPVPIRRSITSASSSPHEMISAAAKTETPNAVQTSTKAAADGSGDCQSNECVVCLERAPDCVLYTCGHICMCYLCAGDVFRNGDALCPVCRQPIRDVIRIFRS